ncbi:hypothetical protein [Xanthomonas perforans]|uniref:hypothetical protein n=1 Tax=Xanthomonas perforans TaxID=442694 RepID=UPI0023595874|nr:hypothetical protein [Xanthomonas perforans]MDC9674516.1 hypothetical protein [Xanthomonas perforans]
MRLAQATSLGKARNAVSVCHRALPEGLGGGGGGGGGPPPPPPPPPKKKKKKK